MMRIYGKRVGETGVSPWRKAVSEANVENRGVLKINHLAEQSEGTACCEVFIIGPRCEASGPFLLHLSTIDFIPICAILICEYHRAMIRYLIVILELNFYEDQRKRMFLSSGDWSYGSW